MPVRRRSNRFEKISVRFVSASAALMRNQTLGARTGKQKGTKVGIGPVRSVTGQCIWQCDSISERFVVYVQDERAHLDTR